MATLQTRVSRARTLNSVDIIQYTDPFALEDANIIIHQIEDFITEKIGEGFFWDILKVDTTVIGQSEYLIPILTSGPFNGAPKLESISINYGQGFIKAREVNRSTLDMDISWYETNQLESDPFYFIADNSVFIHPAPKTAVVNGIKFYGIKSLADVTLSTDDTLLFDGKIPPKYFYVISDGLKQFILARQGRGPEREQAKLIFEKETLIGLINKIGNRKVGISNRQSPNLSKFK